MLHTLVSSPTRLLKCWLSLLLLWHSSPLRFRHMVALLLILGTASGTMDGTLIILPSAKPPFSALGLFSRFIPFPFGVETTYSIHSISDPITDATASTVACNDDGTAGALQLTATASAGTSITAYWNQVWPHPYGPMVGMNNESSSRPEYANGYWTAHIPRQMPRYHLWHC